jgi:hypothetical protein
MAVAQTRTDVERSQPSISEIQGLQNHVDTLRGRAKPQKEIQGLQNHLNTPRGQPKQQKK